MKQQIEKLIQQGLSIKNIDVTDFICKNISVSDIEVNDIGADCYVKLENDCFYFFMSFFSENDVEKFDLINFDKHHVFSFIEGVKFDYNPETIFNHLKNNL